MKVLQHQCISNITTGRLQAHGNSQVSSRTPGCGIQLMRANSAVFGGRPDPAVRIVRNSARFGQLQRERPSAGRSRSSIANSTTRPASSAHTAVGAQV